MYCSLLTVEHLFNPKDDSQENPEETQGNAHWPEPWSAYLNAYLTVSWPMLIFSFLQIQTSKQTHLLRVRLSIHLHRTQTETHIQAISYIIVL